MAGQNSDAETHSPSEKALSSPQAAHEDQTIPTSTGKKSGKRTLQFSDDVCEKVCDSPKHTKIEESDEEEEKGSQDEAEQCSSRNISYPLSSGLGGESRPGSSSGVPWNISSGNSAQSLPPGGNGPFSSNQTSGLHSSGNNFPQAHSAYQPTGLDLYDSPSLASPYSSLSMGRKYPQIPTSEYYTPGVAMPSALHAPVRPDVSSSQLHSEHSPMYSEGIPLSKTPPISQNAMSYPQGLHSSNPADGSAKKQTIQLGPQPIALPEAVIPLYSSPTPPKSSTAIQNSGIQLSLPSDSLYSGEPYTLQGNALSPGLYTGNPESSNQHTSSDNPRPPGYPSGPKIPKTKLKPSEKQTMRLEAQMCAPQGSMGIPHMSSSGSSTYLPYNEPEDNGYPQDSKIQRVSEPVKYMSPTTSMSKRPLAFVAQTSTSGSKPLAYVRPSNPSTSEWNASQVQSSGQDARPSLPSYLHQNPSYTHQVQSSTGHGLPVQRLLGAQGQAESNYYAVQSSPPAHFSEQYSAPNDYLGGQVPSEPPRLQPGYQTSSLPIPAGYVQSPQTPSNGIHRPQTQENHLSSYDPGINGRPSQSYALPVAQTPHVGLPITGDQTPVIPRPPPNPTYSSDPSSLLDNRITPSSSYASNISASVSRPNSAASHATSIPQHKAQVFQIPSNDVLPPNQGYGQVSMHHGLQNNLYLSKPHGNQGQASLGQAAAKTFVPGFNTRLHPPQLNRVLYETNPLHSGVSAYQQSQVPVQAAGLTHATNGVAAPYHNGGPAAGVPYLKNPPVPVSYGASLPQQPNLYHAASGSLPTSNQPGTPASTGQIPNVEISPHLGISNYGKAYESNPPNPMAPGTLGVSQHTLQNPYHIGSPNVIPEQGTSQYASTNQYGGPLTHGTITSTQLSQQVSSSQQSNAFDHIGQVQSALYYPTGNEPQGGRLSYPTSNPGNYASSGSTSLGVPNIAPPSGNLPHGRIPPAMQGISPLPHPYNSVNGSLPPSSIPQSPVPPGATIPPRPGIGFSGRPQGFSGAAQPNEVYEQYLNVLNGIGTMGIDNTGRM